MIKFLTPKNILLIVLAIFLIAGIFITADYGISIDHSQETDRAQIAMRRYSFNDPGDPVAEYLSLGINQYYGTSQMVLYLLVENTMRPLLGTVEFHILHYLFFATFVSGIYGIFILIRRWTSEWAALGAALLYGTQPLFFGHSFINPKDIPSMTVFIFTVAAGFWLADKLVGFERVKENTRPKFADLLRQDWEALTERRQAWLTRFGWLWGGLAVLWLLRLPNLLIGWTIGGLYQTAPESWLGGLFRQVAPNTGSIPAADYIQRAQHLAKSLLDPLVLGLTVIGLGLYFWHFRQPQTQLWGKLRQSFSDRPLRRWWESAVGVHVKAGDKAVWLAAVLAGAVWGFAISVRATNITAGGMIGLYLLLKLRERALLPLAVYTLSAFAMCVLNWPYIWYFGLQGFLDGMTAFADYPFVDGRVWLRGVIPIEELPATYIPHTMLIQFTEPLVLLALTGIILSAIYALRKRLPRLDVFILLSWFILPVLYTALAHPTLYNNFRQFFFITPPLFVFAALAIDWISTRIRQTAVLAVLLVGMLTPGLIEIVRLHPYQYVYYNQLVGGTEGAAGLYELDYWAISFREVMGYINAHTPENGRVMIRGGNDVPAFYARPDIDLVNIRLETTPQELAEFDYVIMTTNNRHKLVNLDIDVYPIVYEVYAGDTLLAVVQETKP